MASSGGCVVLFRKAEAAAEASVHLLVLWDIHVKGQIMQEHLEILDLGDAMVETCCSLLSGTVFDWNYGKFSRTSAC